MVYKLNSKDRKILYELDLNARQSDSQIAKKVRLSQQVVNYRIKNLIKEGVIRQFYTVINVAKLGYTFYKVYFKLQNITPVKEKEILDFLVEHKNVGWVGTCDGRWDLSVSIFAKNIVEFNRVLRELVNKFDKRILNKDILIVNELPHFTRGFLIEKKASQEAMDFGGEPEELKLDETDKKIIALLATNAKLPYLRIIQKTNLSLDVVRYRIKKLQKDGIILGFRAWIDLDKINYQFYKVLLSLQKLDNEKEKMLFNFCKHHKNIVYVLKTIGSWDMEIEFEVRDNKEFHKSMLELRNQFPDIIRDYESLLIFREHKFNYYPF